METNNKKARDRAKNPKLRLPELLPAAVLLGGIALLLAVNNRYRIGDGLKVALVVVGYHKIHTQRTRVLRLADGGNAAVNGDDQGHTLLAQIVDGDGV